MKRCIALTSASLALALVAAGRPKVADADGDGVPQKWEAVHGTSDASAADALLDFDGDGLNNLAEFLTNGRPWGRFEVLRCPVDDLTAGPAGSLIWSEIIAGNRAGEYLVNVTDTPGTRTWLWNPPGGAVEGPAFTAVPVVPDVGVPFNDQAQFLDAGAVFSARDGKALEAATPCDPAAGESAVALANDGCVLVRWRLEMTGAPLPLPPLPEGWHDARLHAAASGCAAGTAVDEEGNARAIVFNDLGWSIVSGAAAGEHPRLLAIADSGLVLGWDFGDTNNAFLWKDGCAVLFENAVPEAGEGFQPAGLTASGCFYGLDFGDFSGTPQPVVLRPCVERAADVAMGATGSLMDGDGDGLADEREALAGLRSDRFDSDGDGWGDLHGIVRRTPRQTKNVTAKARADGLEVFTPRRHPLLSGR